MRNGGIGIRCGARRWWGVSGVALALLFGACAAQSSPSVEINDDGALVQISNPELGVLQSGPDVLDEKAGCVHIRFCTTPGTTNTITCDTNDSVCSSDARYQECLSDAKAVCGRTTPMLFDPPIPCPITGVC